MNRLPKLRKIHGDIVNEDREVTLAIETDAEPFRFTMSAENVRGIIYYLLQIEGELMSRKTLGAGSVRSNEEIQSPTQLKLVADLACAHYQAGGALLDIRTDQQERFRFALNGRHTKELLRVLQQRRKRMQ